MVKVVRDLGATCGSKFVETWKPSFREMRQKNVPVSGKEILKIGKKYPSPKATVFYREIAAVAEIEIGKSK